MLNGTHQNKKLKRYRNNNWRPLELANGDTTGCSCSKPANSQLDASSLTAVDRSAIEVDTLSKMRLLRSFQSNHETRMTSESKHLRSAFWSFFREAFHQSARSKYLWSGVNSLIFQQVEALVDLFRGKTGYWIHLGQENLFTIGYASTVVHRQVSSVNTNWSLFPYGSRSATRQKHVEVSNPRA